MWPTDPLQVHVHDVQRLATVRQGVAVAADEWGVADVDTLVLVVHELASNGLDHGRGPVQVDIRSTGGEVHVAVTDSGAGEPRIVSPTLADERGRGLGLVDLLTDRWGVAPRPGGKTVWAVLDRDRLGVADDRVLVSV